MAWIWNAWAVLHHAASFIIAGFVWTDARGRLQNRALAGLLLIRGASWGARGPAISVAEAQHAFARVPETSDSD